MSQATSGKNKKIIIGGLLLVLILAGLFAAKIFVENKIKAWATEDLHLYDPMIKLESADVDASALSCSVIYKNVVYTVPDVPGLRISIEEMTSDGLDWDTLMGKPGDITTMDKTTMKNLQVSMEEAEQPVLEIGYYECKDLSVPYRDIRAALLANKADFNHKTLIKNFLPIISKSNMSVGSSLMRDMKIHLKQAGVADFYIGEAGSSGFEYLDPATTGFEAMLGKAYYKNMKVQASSYSGEFVGSLDSVEIKGLKYNYKAIMQACANFIEDENPLDLFLEIIPNLYNYAFDELTMDKLAVNFQGVDFTLDSMRFGPRTLKEQGPNAVSGIKVAMLGNSVFELEEIGMTKLVLSDMLVDIINRPKNYVNDKNFAEQLEANPMAMFTGSRLENLYLKNLEAKGYVSLKSWRGDVAAGDALEISSKLEQLQVSQVALKQATVASMYSGIDNLYEILDVLSINPEGLNLDSNLNMLINFLPNMLSYNTSLDITAKGEGHFAMQVSGVTDTPEYYETYGDPLLANLQFVIEDAGAIDHTLNYFVEKGVGESPESIRNGLIIDIDSEIANAEPQEAKMLESIKSFVMEGGKLEITITPQVPTEFIYMDVFGENKNTSMNIVHSK